MISSYFDLSSNSLLLILIVLFSISPFLSHFSVECQVSVEGRFQRLASQNLAQVGDRTVPIYNLPALNNEDLIRLEANSAEVARGVFMFGQPVPVDIDLHGGDGIWEVIEVKDDENVLRRVRRWSLRIQSKTALSLNLLFDAFELSEDAEFYITSEQGLMGAFTAAVNNKESRQFATFPKSGSELLLEYFEPLVEDDLPRSILHINKVVHGYRRVFSPTQSGNEDGFDEGDSARCNINVKCDTNWEKQADSVAIMLTANNAGYCSGAMVNNANNDGTQYFLTANHCVGRSDMRQHLLGFNFQSKTCKRSSSVTADIDTVHGLELVARYSLSDFALFRVLEKIPASYGVYLSGWSISSNSSQSNTPETTEELTEGPGPQYPYYVGIHHPSADIKKISYASKDRIFNDCWSECPSEFHWKVHPWRNGTTEPGSSGSPLFNNEGRIVGQLHGGSASCGNRFGYDLYGGLYASWGADRTHKNSLGPWLNPSNKTDLTHIDGKYLYESVVEEDDEPLVKETRFFF